MLEHSRRTFIQLGTLATAGPLVGRLIPTSLVEASTRSTQDLFVTVRARLIPVLSSGAVMGEYARMAHLAWAQPRFSILPRTRVAAHDCLRELMEDVPPSQEIGLREPPISSLIWYVQLFYVSWTLRDFDRARLADAERVLFRTMDDDPNVSSKGAVYNSTARRRLAGLASALGLAVDVRLPCVVRLDQPHLWGWSSNRPDLNNLVGSGDVIAAHLSKTFVPRLEALVRSPRQWTRRIHIAAAMANLQTYAPHLAQFAQPRA